jgi:uncharacterized membrane protein YqjE
MAQLAWELREAQGPQAYLESTARLARLVLELRGQLEPRVLELQAQRALELKGLLGLRVSVQRARLGLLVLAVHLVFTDRISAMLTKLLLRPIPHMP